MESSFCSKGIEIDFSFCLIGHMSILRPIPDKQEMVQWDYPHRDKK